MSADSTATVGAPRPGRPADTMPDDLRELLAAVVDALDVPLADRAEDDQARALLLSQRASDVRVILASVLKGDGIKRATEHLQQWTAEHPVTFASWVDRGKGAQR